MKKLKVLRVMVRIFRKGAMLQPEEGVVLKALHQLGYVDCTAIRIGKCFEVEIKTDKTEEEIRSSMGETLRQSHLINPVSEVFDILAVTASP